MTLEEFSKNNGRTVELGRGEYVFRQGEHDRSIYLVQSGLLKAYYVTDAGRENIKSFLDKGSTIGSLQGMLEDDGCSFSLVCLEECSLVKIEFDALRAEARRNLDLANELVDLLSKFAVKKERREYELLCLPAEERLQKLLRESPDLLRRVTQNDIALYLGITPVGLSRIKKRISKAR